MLCSRRGRVAWLLPMAEMLKVMLARNIRFLLGPDGLPLDLAHFSLAVALTIAISLLALSLLALPLALLALPPVSVSVPLTFPVLMRRRRLVLLLVHLHFLPFKLDVPVEHRVRGLSWLQRLSTSDGA
jgi:hypothetical protein